MPELPEVECVVRTIRPALVGRLIERFDLRRSDICSPCGVDLPRNVIGRHVTAVRRRAKRIVIELDARDQLSIHLGMSGRLQLVSSDEREPMHTHLVLSTDASKTQHIRFVDPRRFGGLFWNWSEDGLGPEPLDLTPAQFADRLGATSRAIKTALLDQRLIAGIGNIYADEALFDARLHPTLQASLLSREQSTRLLRSIKKVLTQAINAGGSTLRDYVDAEGNPGAYQTLHRVYARAGEPCRRCRAMIERIVLQQRSTHFCPRCQP